MPLQQFARQRGLVAQRLHWWKAKLARADKKALAVSGASLVPVRVSEASRRGEPETVLLRTGHVLKVAHGFDEGAFSRVVALLEGS